MAVRRIRGGCWHKNVELRQGWHQDLVVGSLAQMKEAVVMRLIGVSENRRGHRVLYGVAECVAGERILTHHTLSYMRP